MHTCVVITRHPKKRRNAKSTLYAAEKRNSDNDLPPCLIFSFARRISTAGQGHLSLCRHPMQHPFLNLTATLITLITTRIWLQDPKGIDANSDGSHRDQIKLMRRRFPQDKKLTLDAFSFTLADLTNKGYFANMSRGKEGFVENYDS